MRPTLPLLITPLLASVVHLSAADRFVRAEGAALTQAGMPLFVGELGQYPPYITESPESPESPEDRFAIDLLERKGGDLTAIWAWHFPQHPKYSVSHTHRRGKPTLPRVGPSERRALLAEDLQIRSTEVHSHPVCAS